MVFLWTPRRDALKKGKTPPGINFVLQGKSELSALWEQKGGGLTTHQLKQTKLAMKDIHIAPNCFQPRVHERFKWEIDQHVAYLGQHLPELPRILLFPIDGRSIVLDGHCTLEAWRLSMTTDSARVIPVDYFTHVGKGEKKRPAAFNDALKESIARNAANKLQLSAGTKFEVAWDMVTYSEDQHGCFSNREIAKTAGISHPTVATMVATLKTYPKGGDYDPRAGKWRDHIKRGLPEWDDSKEEEQAVKWRDRLLKMFGGVPGRIPHVFMRALELAWPTATFTRMLARVEAEDLSQAEDWEPEVSSEADF